MHHPSMQNIVNNLHEGGSHPRLLVVLENRIPKSDWHADFEGLHSRFFTVAKLVLQQFYFVGQRDILGDQCGQCPMSIGRG